MIKSAYCSTCGTQRAFERPGLNHILHLLLSLVTCGCWILVWVLLAVLPPHEPYQCRTCGAKLHKSELRMQN
ncbi:MAG: hypothetical protein KAY37_01095 [Phycisphaerae bacterium]|nr:hypothetical protein [Phycisphaerae bacterium]